MVEDDKGHFGLSINHLMCFQHFWVRLIGEHKVGMELLHSMFVWRANGAVRAERFYIGNISTRFGTSSFQIKRWNPTVPLLSLSLRWAQTKNRTISHRSQDDLEWSHTALQVWNGTTPTTCNTHMVWVWSSCQQYIPHWNNSNLTPNRLHDNVLANVYATH